MIAGADGLKVLRIIEAARRASAMGIRITHIRALKASNLDRRKYINKKYNKYAGTDHKT